jgi:hypothetical protein
LRLLAQAFGGDDLRAAPRHEWGTGSHTASKRKARKGERVFDVAELLRGGRKSTGASTGRRLRTALLGEQVEDVARYARRLPCGQGAKRRRAAERTGRAFSRAEQDLLAGRLRGATHTDVFQTRANCLRRQRHALTAEHGGRGVVDARA